MGDDKSKTFACMFCPFETGDKQELQWHFRTSPLHLKEVKELMEAPPPVDLRLPEESRKSIENNLQSLQNIVRGEEIFDEQCTNIQDLNQDHCKLQHFSLQVFQFRCTSCDFRTPDEGVFLQHFENRFNLSIGQDKYALDLKCLHCDLSFDTLDAFNSHDVVIQKFKVSLKKKPQDDSEHHSKTAVNLQCNFCPLKLCSLPALSNHFQEKHSEFGLDVPKVEVILENNQTSLNAFRCQKCDASFQSLQSLRNHFGMKHYGEQFDKIQVTETNNVMYTCPSCPNFWTNEPSRLERHKKSREHLEREETASSNSDIELQCEICNITFMTLKKKELHLKTPKHAKAVTKIKSASDESQPDYKPCDTLLASEDRFHIQLESERHLESERNDQNSTQETPTKAKENMEDRHCPQPVLSSPNGDFRCEPCDYSTNVRSRLIRHYDALKHIANVEKLSSKSNGEKGEQFLGSPTNDSPKVENGNPNIEQENDATIADLEISNVNVEKDVPPHENEDVLRLFKCDRCEFAAKYIPILKRHQTMKHKEKQERSVSPVRRRSRRNSSYFSSNEDFEKIQDDQNVQEEQQNSSPVRRRTRRNSSFVGSTQNLDNVCDDEGNNIGISTQGETVDQENQKSTGNSSPMSNDNDHEIAKSSAKRRSRRSSSSAHSSNQDEQSFFQERSMISSSVHSSNHEPEKVDHDQQVEHNEESLRSFKRRSRRSSSVHSSNQELEKVNQADQEEESLSSFKRRSRRSSSVHSSSNQELENVNQDQQVDQDEESLSSFKRRSRRSASVPPNTNHSDSEEKPVSLKKRRNSSGKKEKAELVPLRRSRRNSSVNSVELSSCQNIAPASEITKISSRKNSFSQNTGEENAPVARRTRRSSSIGGSDSSKVAVEHDHIETKAMESQKEFEENDQAKIEIRLVCNNCEFSTECRRALKAHNTRKHKKIEEEQLAVEIQTEFSESEKRVEEPAENMEDSCQDDQENSPIKNDQGTDQDASITDHDASITDQDASITDQNALITDQDASVADQDASITDQDASITDQNSSITDQDESITDQDASITDQDASVADQDASITDQNASITDQDASITDTDIRLKCDKCEFSTNGQRYLKAHYTKKHKNIDENQLAVEIQTEFKESEEKIEEPAEKKEDCNQNDQEKSPLKNDQGTDQDASITDTAIRLECDVCDFSTIEGLKYLKIHKTKRHKKIEEDQLVVEIQAEFKNSEGKIEEADEKMEKPASPDVSANPNAKSVEEDSPKVIDLPHGLHESPSCQPCGKTFKNLAWLKNHLNSRSHKMNQRVQESNQLKSKVFSCETCNMSTKYKQNLVIHLKSPKHLARVKTATKPKSEETEIGKPGGPETDLNGAIDPGDKDGLEVTKSDLNETSTEGIETANVDDFEDDQSSILLSDDEEEDDDNRSFQVSIEPVVTQKPSETLQNESRNYFCTPCNYDAKYKSVFERHEKSKQHLDTMERVKNGDKSFDGKVKLHNGDQAIETEEVFIEEPTFSGRRTPKANRRDFFMCSPCNFTTSFEKSYMKHLSCKTHRDNASDDSDNDLEVSNGPVELEAFSCHMCQNKFTSNRGLKIHMQKMHADAVSSSRSSTGTFVISDAELEDDPEDEIVPEKSFTCHYCVWSFESQQGLGRHMTVHKIPAIDQTALFKNDQEESQPQGQSGEMAAKVEDMFNCSGCGYQAKSERSLRSHQNKKTECKYKTELHSIEDGERFKCQKCDKKCKNEHGLNLHLKRKHPKDDEDYVPEEFDESLNEALKCSHCYFKSKDENAFAEHVRNNHQESLDKDYYEPDAKRIKMDRTPSVDEPYEEDPDETLDTFNDIVDDLTATEEPVQPVQTIENVEEIEENDENDSASIEEKELCLTLEDDDESEKNETFDKSEEKEESNMMSENEENENVQYHCESCNFRSETEVEFNHHIQHHGETLFKKSVAKEFKKLVCEICGFSSLHNDVLRVHKRQSHGRKRKFDDEYVTIQEKTVCMCCAHCHFKTKDLQDMMNHNRNQHPEN